MGGKSDEVRGLGVGLISGEICNAVTKNVDRQQRYYSNNKKKNF